MSFTPNIPASGQSLGSSRTQILNNFSNINSTIAVNHVAMNAVGAGKHKFAELIHNATIPAGLIAGEGTLYARTLAGNTQIYYSPDASTNEYTLTRTDPTQFTKCGTNTGYAANRNGGFSFVPGGAPNSLFLQYGMATALLLNGNTTITFPRSFGGTPFSVVVTAIQTGGNQAANSINVITGSVTSTQFQVVNSSSGTATSCYWMAIGL